MTCEAHTHRQNTHTHNTHIHIHTHTHTHTHKSAVSTRPVRAGMKTEIREAGNQRKGVMTKQ